MENNQSASLSCTNEPKVELYEYFRKHLQSEYMPIFKPGYGYGEEWALFGTNIITKYSFGARENGDATEWFDERNQVRDLLRWTCKHIFGYNLVFSKSLTLHVYFQVFATRLDKLNFLTEDEKDAILGTVTLMFYARRKVALDYYYMVHQGLPF